MPLSLSGSVVYEPDGDRGCELVVYEALSPMSDALISAVVL